MGYDHLIVHFNKLFFCQFSIRTVLHKSRVPFLKIKQKTAEIPSIPQNMFNLFFHLCSKKHKKFVVVKIRFP